MRSINATSDLQSEYGCAQRILGVMDAMARRVSARETVGPQDRAEVIESLRVFVDGCHHSKGEQMLFPGLSLTHVGPGLLLGSDAARDP